jgi:hypothetical protein
MAGSASSECESEREMDHISVGNREREDAIPRIHTNICETCNASPKIRTFKTHTHTHPLIFFY